MPFLVGLTAADVDHARPIDVGLVDMLDAHRDEVGAPTAGVVGGEQQGTVAQTDQITPRRPQEYRQRHTRRRRSRSLTSPL